MHGDRATFLPRTCRLHLLSELQCEKTDLAIFSGSHDGAKFNMAPLSDEVNN